MLGEGPSDCLRRLPPRNLSRRRGGTLSRRPLSMTGRWSLDPVLAFARTRAPRARVRVRVRRRGGGGSSRWVACGQGRPLVRIESYCVRRRCTDPVGIFGMSDLAQHGLRRPACDCIRTRAVTPRCRSPRYRDCAELCFFASRRFTKCPAVSTDAAIYSVICAFALRLTRARARLRS